MGVEAGARITGMFSNDLQRFARATQFHPADVSKVAVFLGQYIRHILICNAAVVNHQSTGFLPINKGLMRAPAKPIQFLKCGVQNQPNTDPGEIG